MKLHIFSYRFAEEILQHNKHAPAFDEITDILKGAPLFIWPGKSTNNKNLSVLQKVMNTYFDRRFHIDCKWEYHPYATRIPNSGLRADYRKTFNGLAVQAEVQFGNMARWYSDVFKFQAAYSEELIHLGVSILPVASLAKKIDSNVAYFERAVRELPSANLSITHPILLVGVEEDSETPVIDVSQSKFTNVAEVNGARKEENRLRIVNGFVDGKSIAEIGDDAPVGAKPSSIAEDTDDDED